MESVDLKSFVEVKCGEAFLFEKVGDQIIGVLVAKRKGDFESQIYDLEYKDKKFTVFGSTVMDRKMEQVNIGSIVRITYLGEKTGEKSKRKYKDYKVETTK